MTEDEALARAMVISMASSDPPPSSSSVTPEERRQRHERPLMLLWPGHCSSVNRKQGDKGLQGPVAEHNGYDEGMDGC